VGAPRTTNKVSIVKLYREGTQWAADEAGGLEYQTPDPELMFNWLKALDPSDNLEVTLKREQADWLAGVPAAIPRIDFKAGFPGVSEQEQAAVWKSVSLY
jgi:hypothetical protein